MPNAFLEPVYLNEKMVLNCAGYLFKSVALEAEESKRAGTSLSGGLRVGIPLLNKLLSPLDVEGSAQRESARETKTSRRYTIGALHMAVLDELRDRGMLAPLDRYAMSKLDPAQLGYVDIPAVLRPVDFQSLVATLKTIAPLALQLFRDFGSKLSSAAPGSKAYAKLTDLQKSSEKYEKSLTSVLEQLEADYLRSKQLEMVMWSETDGGSPRA